MFFRLRPCFHFQKLHTGFKVTLRFAKNIGSVPVVVVFVVVFSVQGQKIVSGNEASYVENSENIFPEKNFFKPRKPRSNEILLNLNERKRRADIETEHREKILRAQNTELGRLKAEMETDPLKSHQAKLTQFSDKIRNLLEQLQGEEGVQRAVFLDLGNTYLESYRYLNSLNAEDQWKLSRYASPSGTILGSRESALWVFKMALARKPNDGETNFLLGKILSEMGERDLALRRARNAERLFVINSQPARAVQTRSFIEFLKNSSP